jgi:hypothetical protein
MNGVATPPKHILICNLYDMCLLYTYQTERCFLMSFNLMGLVADRFGQLWIWSENVDRSKLQALLLVQRSDTQISQVASAANL